MAVSSDHSPEPEIFNYYNIRKAAMVLRALDHPLRQKIFNFLAGNENSTVTNIIFHLNLEQAVISQHLAILRRAKIIYNLKNGKFVHYYIDQERVAEINSITNSLIHDTNVQRSSI